MLTRTMAAAGSAAVLATAMATGALATTQPTATSTAAPATSSAAGNTTAGCQPSALSAGLHGLQLAGGHTGFILTLTNLSSNSCTVDGYPGLGLQNAAHHELPSTTFRGATYFDPDPGAKPIVLSPGETASADVAYGDNAPASPVAAYLEVTPPNDTHYLTVPIPRRRGHIDKGVLDVTALARHTPY